jgi:hypothetical protein
VLSHEFFLGEGQKGTGLGQRARNKMRLIKNFDWKPRNECRSGYSARIVPHPQASLMSLQMGLKASACERPLFRLAKSISTTAGAGRSGTRRTKKIADGRLVQALKRADDQGRKSASAASVAARPRQKFRCPYDRVFALLSWRSGNEARIMSGMRDQDLVEPPLVTSAPWLTRPG